MEYTVKDPLGKTHIISGPEGASETEILKQAALLFPDANSNISVTPGEAAAAGMVNAATLGFAPELMGGDRSDVQNALQQAKKQQLPAYIGGSIVGATVPALGASSVGGGIAANAGMGALSGLGNGVNAPNATPLSAAGNAALGGATAGLATGATQLAGAGLSSLLGKLTQWASGLDSATSAAIYKVAQAAPMLTKEGLTFSEQIDNLQNEAEQVLEGRQLAQAQDAFKKLSGLQDSVPTNALTSNTLNYAIKMALGGLSTLGFGHPLVGAGIGALVGNPAASAAMQQVMGSATPMLANMAGQAASQLAPATASPNGK